MTEIKWLDSNSGEFEKQGVCRFATRSVECFDGALRNGLTPIWYWQSRFAVEQGGIKGTEFKEVITERIRAIQTSGISVLPVLGMGIDSRGYPFLITETADPRKISDSKPSTKSFERLFQEICKCLNNIHKKGITLGDISADTFGIDSSGRPIFLAVLGGIEGLSKQTAALPPAEAMCFLAPEQKNGRTSPHSDIYSLGILGYKIWTGRVPLEARSEFEGDVTSLALPPSEIRSGAPVWLDDILNKCLEHSENNRFEDSEQLYTVVSNAISTGLSPGGKGLWSKKRGLIVVNQKNTSNTNKEKFTKNEQILPRRKFDFGYIFIKFAGILLVVGFITWLAVSFLKRGRPSNENVSHLATITDLIQIAPPEIKSLIYDIITPDVTKERKLKALSEIAEDHSAGAIKVLGVLLIGLQDPELKAQAALNFANRISGDGNKQLAEMFMGLVQNESSTGQIKVGNRKIESYVELMGENLNVQQKINKLKILYQSEPLLISQIVGAICVDNPEEGGYQNLLKEILAHDDPKLGLKERKLEALLLSSPTLAFLFKKTDTVKIKDFSDDDLVWTLKNCAKYDSPYVIDFTKEIVNRRIVPPYQMIYFNTLADDKKGAISSALQKSIIEGGSGILQKNDVLEISKWLSIKAENLLLAGLVVAKDDEVANLFMDAVTNRTINNPVAYKITQWIRNNRWEDRYSMARAVGILSFLDITSEEDIDHAFDILLPYLGANGIIKLSITLEENTLIRRALFKFGAMIPSIELLPLLSNSSKEIRIEAVKGLKDRNELVVLQAILREYQKETDEEVKNIYREFHWVTVGRDRTGPVRVVIPPPKK